MLSSFAKAMSRFDEELLYHTQKAKPRHFNASVCQSEYWRPQPLLQHQPLHPALTYLTSETKMAQAHVKRLQGPGAEQLGPECQTETSPMSLGCELLASDYVSFPPYVGPETESEGEAETEDPYPEPALPVKENQGVASRAWGWLARSASQRATCSAKHPTYEKP